MQFIRLISSWFVVFTIIYCISIFVTIIPSYFKHPVLIANILLTFSIFVNIFLQNKLTIKLNSIDVKQFLSVVILIILVYFFRHLGKNGLSFTTLAYLTFISLLTFLSLSVSIGIIRKTLKTYIFVIAGISFFGLISWILFNFEFIDASEYLFSAYHFSDGKIGRELAYAYRLNNDQLAGYNAPFYFGLITTANQPFDIFSFQFYRSSGWSHEPTTAACFLVPAYITLLFDKSLYSSRIRRIFLFLIALFYFTVFAIGSVIAVILTYLTYVFIINKKYKFSLKIFPSIFIFLISLLTIAFNSTKISERFFTFSNSELVLSGSMYGVIHQIFWFLETDFGAFWIHKLLLVTLVVFTLTIAIKKARNSAHEHIGFAIAIIYYCLHGLKGSWQFIMVYGLFIFLLCVMFRFYNIKNETNKVSQLG